MIRRKKIQAKPKLFVKPSGDAEKKVDDLPESANVIINSCNTSDAPVEVGLPQSAELEPQLSTAVDPPSSLTSFALQTSADLDSSNASQINCNQSTVSDSITLLQSNSNHESFVSKDHSSIAIELSPTATESHEPLQTNLPAESVDDHVPNESPLETAVLIQPSNPTAALLSGGQEEPEKENNQQLCQRQIICVDQSISTAIFDTEKSAEKSVIPSEETVNEPQTNQNQITVQFDQTFDLNYCDDNDYIALQPVCASLEPFYTVAQQELHNLDDPHSLDCLPTPMISPFKPLLESVRNQAQRTQLNQVARAISTEVDQVKDANCPTTSIVPESLGNNNIDENNNVDAITDEIIDELDTLLEPQPLVRLTGKKATKSKEPKKNKKAKQTTDDSDYTPNSEGIKVPKKKVIRKKKDAGDSIEKPKTATKRRRSKSIDDTESIDDAVIKKRHRRWNKNAVVDKNKLTMFDLISYNPPPLNADNTEDDAMNVAGVDSEQHVAGLGDPELSDKVPNNPIGDLEGINTQSTSLNRSMESATDEAGRSEPVEPGTDKDPTDPVDAEDEGDDKADEEPVEEETQIGPRVRVNEKGELVLDEKSLIVKRKKNTSKVKTVFEDEKSISSLTNYSSFKRNGKQLEKKSRWTDSETVKFYTALTIIGTDFTLMAELFFRNKRSRLDLKNKFKNEEKYHKVLIDNALKGSDLSSLNNIELLSQLGLSDDENEESDAVRRQAQITESVITTT
jgi:hypothetical protein